MGNPSQRSAQVFPKEQETRDEGQRPGERPDERRDYLAPCHGPTSTIDGPEGRPGAEGILQQATRQNFPVRTGEGAEPPEPAPARLG